MLYIGNNEIKKIYLGETNISSGYVGTTPFWGGEEPPVTNNKARLVLSDSTVVEIPFTGAGDTVLTSGEISPYKNNLISAVIYDGVTSIGDSAFTSCSSLTSVTIGDGVTSIGRNAFRYCSGLTSITVEATTPPTLANSLALRDTNNCPIYVPCESVDSYKTAWSSYASRIGCKFTKAKLTLTGGTVVEILSTGGTELSQDEISPYINSVVSAVIYDGVTSIGDFAFFECSGLTSVTIPNSVTSIGDWAFRECSSLTSIVIPSGVTSIGMGAFYYDALTSITIPNSVTSLGAGAFYACPLTSANIPSGITSLENAVFAKCSSLTSIVIPSDITLFGYRVFEDCSGLTSVTIPSGVTSIGYSAFTNCSSLTSITVKSTTPATIGGNAFDNTNDAPIYVPCSSLDTYKAAAGWSTYADRITCIPEPVLQDKHQFALTNGTVKTFKQTSTADTAVNESLSTIQAYQNTASAWTIFDVVTTIETNVWAFRNFSVLKEVTIGNGLSTLPQSMFCGVTSVSSVTFGSGLTTIGGDSLRGTSIKNIDIPDSVETIGGGAFAACNKLKTVTIGTGVTSIGNLAFTGCTSLTSITINRTTPPTLLLTPFDNTNNCPIYVPADSVNAYKTAAYWAAHYADRIQAIP